MNKPDQTQEPQPEQLLKMLDIQLAAARERRTARESSRTRTGVVGIVIIIVGAMIALFVLVAMLEQMRPQRSDGAGQMRTEAR